MVCARRLQSLVIRLKDAVDAVPRAQSLHAPLQPQPRRLIELAKVGADHIGSKNL